MSTEVVIVGVVLAGAVTLFVTEKLRVDLVALLVMGVLLVTGVLTPAQGLAGFSNPATLTVGAMFVLSAGLFRTGAVSALGGLVTRLFQRGYWGGLLAVMAVVGVLSAFINNTPVIALFLPILLGVARATRIAPSKLLMPVSFASMFGGVCTLIGTSTNILVSSIAVEQGLRPFTMFEFAPLGLVLFALGTAWLALAGVRLIPERGGGDGLVGDFSLNEYLAEVVLLPGAASIGTRIADAPLVKELELSIVKLERDGHAVQLPSANEVLREGDVLLVRCDLEQIRKLQERQGVEFKAQAKWADETLAAGEHRLVELVVLPNSRLVGSTLQRAWFRERYGGLVLALRHRGKLLRQRLSDTVLSAGDVLLVKLPVDRLPGLRRGGDLLVTSEVDSTEFRRDKAAVAIGVMAAVVLAASTDAAPIVVAALVGALALVLTRCLSLEEAYAALDWKILFLLAGVLSLGVALESSGAAALVSGALVEHVGRFGPVALISAFYLLTSLLTETMSNNATAALLAPIAITTARALGVEPTPFLMAITFAASASFMTPVGYQTNTMIYGPGRYEFADFLKVGTPLNVISWLAATALIPVFWPP
jgi:di/tricarboxylate transporter